ncbi:MAG: hypothetical protein JNK95_10165 [Candidatus Competibacter sp.]|nr:hypothetical protein [Candidatus Competibacter sp.]MDG4604620.1 hypothetical protein [Candidatus Contendobacter sp.]HRD50180.1 hypothetical protein [Candidatus Contendobacter sp.]
MPTHQRKIASNQRTADGWRRLWAACGLCAGLALTPIMAVEAAWTAAIQPDPVTRQARCLLTSETQTTPAGHDDSTPVSLVFNGSSLLVVTRSDLDPSFADLQLAVDDKPPLRSDKIVRKTDLAFDQNVPELVQLLRSGRQITVYLRFWPTWPATQTFPVRFSLSGFSKAYDSLNQNCQSAPASTPAPTRPAR